MRYGRRGPARHNSRTPPFLSVRGAGAPRRGPIKAGAIGPRLLYRSQDQSVTAVQSERGNQRGISLPAGNKQSSWTVVQIVNSIVVALLAWIVVAAVLAVVFGRVIRTRDKHEIPPALDQDDERWRDAG